MATQAKPGARNDLFALKEARRCTNESSRLADRVIRDIQMMREQVGRPDYGLLTGTLGQLALSLSKSSTALDEMWMIRSLARQSDDEEELTTRLADLETQVQRLQQLVQERELA